MKENLFNNYNLTHNEVCKILCNFENIINAKTSKLGDYKEDCMQEIKIQIYKTLTKNRRK